MRQLASFIVKNFGNWKITLVGLGIFLLIQIILAFYVIPNIRLKQPLAISNGLLIMMDGQPLASASKQYEVINLYKHNILDYVYMLYCFDFLLPVSLAIFFASLIGILVKRLNKVPNFIILVVLLPVIFDYLENSIAFFLIKSYPAQTFPNLAQFEGIVTALKLTSSGLVILITVFLFFIYLSRKLLKST